MLINKYIKRKIKGSSIPVIETTRLKLRPFILKDSIRVQLLAGDEAISDGAVNIPHPYPNGVAESWISTHEKEFLKGNSIILAITLKDSELLIGSIGLYINGKHKHAELGYWIGKDYWCQGYCSEAVGGIIKFAFETLFLNKIFANFISRNPSSGKVLVKNGFVKEGYLKKHIKCKTNFEDIECYGLLKTDYLERKKSCLAYT